MGMGGGEMLIVFATVLVLFGAKRIPEFAKGLGQGIKEFRKASSGVTNEIQNAMSQELPPPAPSKALPSSASALPEATAPNS
jgi:sec-independent protein translocase protein TatA